MSNLDAFRTGPGSVPACDTPSDYDRGARLVDRCRRLTDDGRSTCLFFVRGIRHRPEAAPAVAVLRAGDALALVDDHGNRFNSRAVLLSSDGTAIGWVPDYLVEHVHQLRQVNGVDPSVIVEHVNDEASPPHQRVLCRLEAPWPLARFNPFDEARYEPLADLSGQI